MARYFTKRVLSLIPTLLGVSVAVFLLVYLMPGRPADINRILMMASPDQQTEILEKTDLNAPVTEKFITWAGNLFSGNLGYSSSYKEPVWDLIKSRMGYTILLASVSLVFSILLSIPLGVRAALKKNSFSDHLVSTLSFIGFSIPAFFLAQIFILIFSVKLNLLPLSGALTVGKADTSTAVDLIRHLILPCAVLTCGSVTANLLKQTRASMVNEISQEYCRAATARGIGEKKVIWKHAFRNSLKPLITLICMQIPNLFSGTLVVEAVFSWPGIGRLNYEATINRDYQLIMGIVMVVAVVTLLSNLLADILYMFADPRIALQDSGNTGKEQL